eukprot:symbB.v1.2.014764.t1/scaffold1084.1/size139254/3
MLSLQPRVGQGTALVFATIGLRILDGYPAVAPVITIEKSRGLSDGGVAALKAKAMTALETYEGEACLCQVIEEINEALDLANDESECLICLQACGSVTDASVVHAPCGHVYHATCLGHWARLKKSEAHAAVEDSTQGVRSQRDALAREVAELTVQLDELTSETQRLEELVAKLNDKLMLQRKMLEEGEEVEEPPEDEPSLDDQLATAKEDLKSCLSKKRKSETKCSDLSRELGRLEAELEASTGTVNAAGLPCPVCRAPIAQDLLPAVSPGAGPAGPSSGSVANLPQELQQQVRQLQREHQAILEDRLRKEELQRQAELKAAEEAQAAAAEAEAAPASRWENDWSQREWKNGYHEEGISKGKGRRRSDDYYSKQNKQSGKGSKGGNAENAGSTGRSNRWHRA